MPTRKPEEVQTIAGAIAVGVMLHVLDHIGCDFIRIANCDEESYNLYLREYFGSEKPNYIDILGSAVGITGVFMVVLMVVAFVLATSWFRRSSVKLPWQLDKLTGFNAFWYSHHAFVVIYVLLLVHSIRLFFVRDWREKSVRMTFHLVFCLFQMTCLTSVENAWKFTRWKVKTEKWISNFVIKCLKENNLLSEFDHDYPMRKFGAWFMTRFGCADLDVYCRSGASILWRAHTQSIQSRELYCQYCQGHAVSI